MEAEAILIQMEVAQFGAGVITSFVVLPALSHWRLFAQAALALTAMGVVYVLASEGVQGLVDLFAAAFTQLRTYHDFANGLLVGKFASAMVTWVSTIGRKRR